ncbi:3362_t:CDS:1, partial [Funneliformis geosporum]
EPGKIFTQKEAEGEFQCFDILKNKHFNIWAPIAIFSSKPLLLACQEYLYKNIRKFVDEPFQDIMCPKPIIR